MVNWTIMARCTAVVVFLLTLWAVAPARPALSQTLDERGCLSWEVWSEGRCLPIGAHQLNAMCDTGFRGPDGQRPSGQPEVPCTDTVVAVFKAGLPCVLSGRCRRTR